MRTSGKAATIYDIAKLAGVNPSTVSRALSTPGRINEATEAKVHAAAKQLNYRVNPFARALPTGKTKMIALMVADITNPVFFKIVSGAEVIAAEFGYTLVVAESQESSSREAHKLQRILPMVDGVIFATTRLADDEIHNVNGEKPVVLINRLVDNIADVVPHNEPGIREAAAHLASLGHKNIAYLGGPAASWINAERLNILTKSAIALGLTVTDLGSNVPTLTTGKDSLKAVVDSGVTAVVAFNDLMAIGLLRAATVAGINVPSQLSIIGFDNIFGSDFTSPPLTTIEMPLEQIGGNAVRALLQTFESENADVPHGSELSTSLLVRGSTAKASK